MIRLEDLHFRYDDYTADFRDEDGNIVSLVGPLD